MKSFVAYLLFFAISIQIAGNLITIAAFELNREFIAKNLCVNRNKPKSHCNGKCHLMKALQKEEKKNDYPTNSLKDKMETVLFSESLDDNFVYTFQKSIRVKFTYIENTTQHFKNSIFHPPLV